jgi:4-diphosphocytidyl-2-C-methyl-D-erythritol kinase
MKVSLSSPAKVNLFLAVTGRRADGFHDLVSVVALLDFFDELEVAAAPTGFTLECDDAAVPADGSNLVLKAAAAFAAATGWKGGGHFKLTKRIPMGAGLGGGSSNAVTAVRLLETLSGVDLTEAKRAELVSGIGSDCALFLRYAPVVMRGRGERIELLPDRAVTRLCPWRILLFKPAFGIGTAWAYGRMAQRGTDYLPASEAEARLATWIAGTATAGELLFNNMQPAAFEKYIALPVLLERLRREFGVAVAMSGSGSTCFALLREDFAKAPVVELIRQCWGPSTFIHEARIL